MSAHRIQLGAYIISQHQLEVIRLTHQQRLAIPEYAKSIITYQQVRNSSFKLDNFLCYVLVMQDLVKLLEAQDSSLVFDLQWDNPLLLANLDLLVDCIINSSEFNSSEFISLNLEQSQNRNYHMWIYTYVQWYRQNLQQAIIDLNTKHQEQLIDLNKVNTQSKENKLARTVKFLTNYKMLFAQAIIPEIFSWIAKNNIALLEQLRDIYFQVLAYQQLQFTYKTVVAKDLDNVIGCNNSLYWNLPKDLEFFKQDTLGSICYVGRNTFESFRKGKNGLLVSLPNRLNFVISSHATQIHLLAAIDNLEFFYQINGFGVAKSLNTNKEIHSLAQRFSSLDYTQKQLDNVLTGKFTYTNNFSPSVNTLWFKDYDSTVIFTQLLEIYKFYTRVVTDQPVLVASEFIITVRAILDKIFNEVVLKFRTELSSQTTPFKLLLEDVLFIANSDDSLMPFIDYYLNPTLIVYDYLDSLIEYISQKQVNTTSVSLIGGAQLWNHVLNKRAYDFGEFRVTCSIETTVDLRIEDKVDKILTLFSNQWFDYYSKELEEQIEFVGNEQTGVKCTRRVFKLNLNNIKNKL